MRELFAIAERGDFREFLRFATSWDVVQGVTIDVDPYWLTLAKLRRRMPPDIFSRFEEDAWEQISRGWGLWRYLDTRVGFPEADIQGPPLDLNWVPKWWRDYQRLHGQPPTGNPFLVRVALVPWSREEKAPDFREFKFEFPVVVERRSVARFCSLTGPHSPLIGGLSVGTAAGDSGTLGGIVKDSSGRKYGLTCGHVLGSQGSAVHHPAPNDSPAAKFIGTVGPRTALHASNSQSPCNADNPASRMNRADAALIDFNGSVPADLRIASLGPLTGIFQKMNLQPGAYLYYVGKESGPAARQLVTGGLNVTYRLKDAAGNYFCFENTFQIRWPRASRPNAAPPVESGDSGAWLCRPDATGYAWAGVVLGCDDDIAYGIFSEEITSWAAAAPVNLTLRVN